MYNFYPYNSQAYNYTQIPVSLTQDSIVFDGYSLQSASIITSRIDYDNQWNIELNSFNFPRADGGGVLSKYYRGRTITLDCTIKSDTRANFEALLDMTKKALRKTEWYLEIKVWDEIRRIKATLSKFDPGRQHYNITFARVSIEFTAVEPFFYTIWKQSFEFLWVTWTITEDVDNAWSVESLPTFYIIGTTGANMTSIALTYGGKTMTIPTTIVANDVLIIDSEEKEVKKNGNPIDYTWFFPVFTAWSSQFTLAPTGTVAIDVTLLMNKNYL